MRFLGVSLKSYFTPRMTEEWLQAVRDGPARHEAVTSGMISLAVMPDHAHLRLARAVLGDSRVAVGCQDVSLFGPGPHTGDPVAAHLADLGVSLAVVGHAERRRDHGETDEIVAAKARAAAEAGLTPMVCVGEEKHTDPAAAGATCAQQLAASTEGLGRHHPLIVAYEPVWAIGADQPATVDHVSRVVEELRLRLAHRPDTHVVYGGSAGPGAASALAGAVDGLFLGRRAHEAKYISTVLDEMTEA